MFYPKVGEFLSDDTLMADERTHTDGNGAIVSDEVLWALTDRQGSVNDLAKRDATTGTTAVVDHIIRDSFGKVISETDPSQGSLIGWTGRPVDKATGQQNNLNRWYDPIIAGWMTQDPKGFAAGQSNLYVYCGNSPTNATDPSGLNVYLIVSSHGGGPGGLYGSPVVYDYQYFYAPDDAEAATIAGRRTWAPCGPLVQSILVDPCGGNRALEVEVVTILNTAVNSVSTISGYINHHGLCGAWVSDFLDKAPPQWQVMPTNLRNTGLAIVRPVYCDVLDSGWYTRLFAAAQGTVPSHYSVQVNINGSLAYLDDGFAGNYENGIYIYTLDGRCPPTRQLGPVHNGPP